jgi:hypothetical protein
MKAKLLGIILSIVGISGLILAFIYMNEAGSASHVNVLIASGICGTLIFFAGLRLIPGEKTYGKPMKVSSERAV